MTIPPLFSFALPTLVNNVITWGSFDPWVPQPHQVTFEAPPLIGVDGAGIPQVLGYGKLTWVYTRLPSDQWYYLMALLRQSRASSTMCGIVKVQWPDPGQNNALVSAPARLDPPATQTRLPRIVSQLTLVFSHLGVDLTVPQTGLYLPPSR